jgi:GxxExxY protein
MSKARSGGRPLSNCAVTIGRAIEVHCVLGPGLLESAYCQCLCCELTLRKLPFKFEAPLPIVFKGLNLTVDFNVPLLREWMVRCGCRARGIADRLRRG